MEFFATCPSGFEDLLTDELKRLRLDRVRKLQGQVSFEGELKDAYKACLHSRLASRIVYVLGRFQTPDSETLYNELAHIAWEDHIKQGATIAVDAHGTNDNLRNTQFLAMRTKDAISDTLNTKLGWRASVDTDNPSVLVVVRLNQSKLTVGIDLTGKPLVKRGYEPSFTRLPGSAPLRGDYAAALLYAAGWHEVCKTAHATLVLPFVGAGALAVEAAQMASDFASGLLRDSWGFNEWKQHDKQAWNKLVAEAEALFAENKTQKSTLHIIASDSRPNCENLTKTSLRMSGMTCDFTYIHQISNTKLLTKLLKRCHSENSCMISDVSWSNPLNLALEADNLQTLASFSAIMPAQTASVTFACNELANKALASSNERIYTVKSGRDTLKIRMGKLTKDSTLEPLVIAINGKQHSLVCFNKNSSQFASRLQKVTKQRRKWAEKEWVSCYRIYDADLPDYAVAIDLYQDTHKVKWLVISEYAAPKEIDVTTAHERLLDVITLTPKILGVEARNTFIRVRTKEKGGSQYAQADKLHKGPAKKQERFSLKLLPGAHLVEENGLTFEVNFEGKLDTGLFLDHRDTRNMLREMMKNTQGSKRFLNLFAYTGSATCYGADGGAKYTTTVDLSITYLNWAKRNMVRNGFEGDQHEYIQTDVLAWVNDQRHTKNRWDLIFCDPPTFSNSSRMRSKSFEIQRDHVELLIDISRLLTRNGICVFSCNLRNFKPDLPALAKAGVELTDITKDTIPHDFERNPKIHHCYLLKRVPIKPVK